jgi:hypothetical protein
MMNDSVSSILAGGKIEVILEENKNIEVYAYHGQIKDRGMLHHSAQLGKDVSVKVDASEGLSLVVIPKKDQADTSLSIKYRCLNCRDVRSFIQHGGVDIFTVILQVMLLFIIGWALFIFC